MYTDGFIQELLECEKQVIDPPSKDFKEDRGQLKKAFSLQSIDKKYAFNAFIRGNTHFNENFSVGLDYDPKEEKGTLCLLRCNGAHGENRMFPHHSHFHIHKANAESINNGLKPESNIVETNDYASLEEAIQYFIKIINISPIDRRKYFPVHDIQTKLNLFDNE